MTTVRFQAQSLELFTLQPRHTYPEFSDAMSKSTHVLIAVAFLGLIDAAVPFFPILGLVLFYVILDRPPWFLEIVRDVYRTNGKGE